MVALAPAKTSTSWPRIARAGAFCINILSDEQSDLCSSFAVTGTEKFAGVQWRRGRTGAPVLEGVVAWIECQLGAIHDAGDHELVLGHVVAMGTGAGDPLLYYQSRFHSIAS
jgi:flavin reductase (DIM6/NTAB) family NADH-FMN oxidoreductase RutF